jgi:hypothetical protein
MQSIEVKDAVLHKANPITLAPEFSRALQQSQFPLVVLFMGYSRAGKSTRLNQIVTKGNSLNLRGPFVARGGSDAVTVGFQACGPIPFDQLNDFHGLGLTIDRNRNPDVFLVDCEGMDHLDGSSPGFGKSMFALAQISAVNVIVFPALMSLKDIPPLTKLFQMSRIVQAADRQLETGFVVIEREIDPVSRTGDPLPDGTNEFEEGRHKQDMKRHKTVCQFLKQGNVRFKEENVLVLDQPTFENRVSYWNSLHDLMRGWYRIASKTLALPGKVLVEMFQMTIMTVQKLPNCDNLDIGFGELLTRLVREQFINAKRLTTGEFPELIDGPIQHLTVDELKQFKKWEFTADAQERVISLFQAKANEVHPFVCESFRTVFEEFCDELRSEVASSVNGVHLGHCTGTLLVDKVTRLLAKCENQIKSEVDHLQQDIGRVETYPFAKWGGELADWTEEKLRKCMGKYDAPITHLPQFREGIESLRKRVTGRVSEVEFQMRKSWKDILAVKVEREREQMKKEMNDKITQLQQENREKDQHMTQEIQRRVAEATKASKEEQAKMQAFFTNQIESMNRAAEHQNKEW